MTVTALEISLNGKVLYTVGMEGWFVLHASIFGDRLTKEMHEQMMDQMDDVPEDFEASGWESLFLSANVAVPNSDGLTSGHPHSYGQEALTIGDVVTIRVVETDNPDLPEPQLPDFRSRSEESVITLKQPSE
jgi:hypothetical protein